MDNGVEFVACDFPTANRLTIHILAAMAEHEREMISKRTKDALKVAKERGIKLGNPNNLSVEEAVRGRKLGIEEWKLVFTNSRGENGDQNTRYPLLDFCNKNHLKLVSISSKYTVLNFL